MMRRKARRHADSAVLFETIEPRLLFSTFTVTNTNDSGSGSLRQAILNANKTTAADTIKFAIGSGAKTISPVTALPAISQPTIVDGSSQPGFAGKPLIEISGSKAGSNKDGLKLTGSGITVKNLVINKFGGSGIFIYSKGGNKITGCYLGVDRAGSLDYGNNAHGIIIQSPNNTIGGTSSADRNVISGNGGAGVFLYTSSANHNKILGNYIGTDAGGTKSIKNHNGVQINGGGYNTVGGTAAGSKNVLSGNEHDGVLMVTSGSSNNSVQGNYIGTNSSGTAKLGNGWYGVEISQPNNSVGGTTSAARNVISGNGYAGVVVYLSTGVNNRVEGNFIGTDYTGTKDLGNTGAGVDITNGAKNNIIGGSTSASRNIICGNDLFGVGIYNSSSGNMVQNNYIGITASGMTLLNSKNAVLVSDGSSGNTFKSNCIACCSGYKTLQFVSGGNTSTSNSLYEKMTSGKDII